MIFINKRGYNVSNPYNFFSFDFKCKIFFSSSIYHL